MNKLPHPENCKYDIYTGLCDYCGKPDMKPKKVRKSKLYCSICGSEKHDVHPIKSKEPRCKIEKLRMYPINFLGWSSVNEKFTVDATSWNIKIMEKINEIVDYLNRK